MEFGLVLQTNPPSSRVVELTKRAEDLGFTHVWAFDSHVLWQEPFVIFSRMLAATEKVIVGPMVTNPGTRDWTVLASLFATLNEMSGGRTICGMGRGDSALRFIGRTPRTLAAMSRSMHVIKGLVAGHAVVYNDKTLQIPWIGDDGYDLPMWVAGYGPRALDLIGRQADGFILQLADPQLVEWTVGHVRAGAFTAERDPMEVKVCVAAPAYVGDDLDHQRTQVRWFGAMVGNHVTDLVDRYGGDGTTLPQALTDYIAERKEYDYTHHGKSDNPTAGFVTDAVVDRFCLLGPVEDHIARLRELEALGVDQFAVYLMHDDMDATLETYGRDIIPVLAGE